MKKAIKIGFDANPLVGQKTGIGLLEHNLILNMAKSRPDIVFVGHYFNFLNKKKIKDLPCAPNIQYRKSIFIPGKLLGVIRRIGLQLPCELYFKCKLDLIFFTNYVSNPSLFRSKIITWIYDLSYIDCPEYTEEGNRIYLQKWVLKTINRSHLIVTISEFTKKRINDVYGVALERIITMPIPPQPKPTLSQSQANVHVQGEYILFVGTLEPRKNLVKLMEAYELLPKRILQNTSLVIAGGKGWKDEKIFNKISELQNKGLRVVSTGYISDEDKSVLYRNALLVIQLSHYEGFGMPILEAMNHGIPTICSDIEVFHEVAQDAAVFVDKDDAGKIASTIKTMLLSKTKREFLSKQGKIRVLNYPNWKSTSTKLLNYILEHK